jgi:hypothetical protein
MNDISKRFEQFVASENKKLAQNDKILPIKTDSGILVGDVLIRSNGPLKDLTRHGKVLFKEISLNEVTIKLANLLANRKDPQLCEKIYQLDQDYGKWFNEWQILKQRYVKSLRNKEYDRADMLMVKYEDAKYRAESAKQSVLLLIRSE